LTEYGKMLAMDEPNPRTNSTQTPTTADIDKQHIIAQTFPPSGPPRLQLAYDTLMRARNALLVGFGKENDGGKVGSEVREMLKALEKETAVWKVGVRNVLQDTPRSGISRQ
jgi:SET and MYND domain-containing protein